MRFRVFLIIFIFCIAGWFLFTYKLIDVPPGINGDEAAIGYSAALISKKGYDSSGKFLPLFTTISWPDWKQPVTIYSTVLMFKLFGISYFNLKAVSVLFVLVSGIIIFFLIREIFDERFAALSFLIYSTIPIIMIQSHLAIENIAPVPFVALWLLMITKYTKIRKTKYLIFSAVALGISIYSYLGLRLIMPILTILSVLYIYYLNKGLKLRGKKVTLRHIFIFLAVLIPFFIILLLIKNQYPAAAFALNRPQHLQSYQQFLLPYISSFDLSFLFMKGDLTPYHSTGRQGMFLLATLPLFIMGLFFIAKERKPMYIFILAVFFLSPILYGLPGQIYRASRLLSLIPAFIVICTFGIKGLFKIRRKTVKVLSLFVIILLIFLNYVDFLFDYWFDYPQRVNQSFEKPLHRVFDYTSKLSKKENLEVFIQDDAPLRNPTVYSFFENAYFPKGLRRWTEKQDLPVRSIIMISAQVYHRIHKPGDIETIDYGSMDLSLLINRSMK